MDSAYSNYWTGGHSQVGYEADNPQQAIQLAARHLRPGAGPTCSYIYLPQVDSAAHKLGATHEVTLKAARDLDSLLGGLAESLPCSARIVVTADHGHLDAPEDRDKRGMAGDELPTLRWRTYGCHGPSMPMYLAGCLSSRMPAQAFGEDFIVLTAKRFRSGY